MKRIWRGGLGLVLVLNALAGLLIVSVPDLHHGQLGVIIVGAILLGVAVAGLRELWGPGLVLVFALALVLLASRPAHGQAIDGLGDLSRLGYLVRVEGDTYQFRKPTGGSCFGALALNWEYAGLVCPRGAQVDGEAQRVLLRQVGYRNFPHVKQTDFWGLHLFAVYADHGLLAGADAQGE